MQSVSLVRRLGRPWERRRRAFVSLYVSVFNFHLCSEAPPPLCHREGPHGSDYVVQRVKLQREPAELEPSYFHSLIHWDLHTWTQARQHVRPSGHTHTRRYKDEHTHTHSYGSSAATLPEAVHFHCWLCRDKAAVCSPPRLTPSPGLERGGGDGTGPGL